MLNDRIYLTYIYIYCSLDLYFTSEIRIRYGKNSEFFAVNKNNLQRLRHGLKNILDNWESENTSIGSWSMIYHQCANNNRLAWVQHCLNLYDFAFYYFRRSMKNKYIELFYEEINISLTDACSNVNCVMVGCLKYGIWMNVDVEVSETTRKFNAAESCT